MVIFFLKKDSSHRKTSRYIEDLYCEKKITEKDGVGVLKIPNYKKVNCEHLWPQSRFNLNKKIKNQKNDFHHLFPVNSQSNTIRSSNIMAEVSGKYVNKNCLSSKFGYAIGTNIRAFEPPSNIKGDIARALFYFSINYKMPISNIEENYLRRWHEADPVSEDEKQRNNTIFNIQKNRNPFIDAPKLVDLIKNF